MLQGKKVLVAGGTGTIGTVLVRKLRERGAVVSVLSMDSQERAKAALGDVTLFKRGDMRDYQTCLEAVEGQDCVINLMAIKGSTQIGVSKVASAYVPFLQCNTNFMDAAFKKRVERYLFVGSIGEYPALDIRHEDDLWLGPPQANDRFMGIAKRAGETQAEAYLHEHGWDAVRIVRPSNVYGPWDDFDPRTAHVVPSLISRMVNGENPVKVAGDGSARRDLIFVDDVADGMILALEKAPPCVPINLGSGVGVSIREVAETIAARMDPPPRIEWDPSRPTGDQVRVLDVQRAKDLLGFQTTTTLAEGIGKTIDWYREHKDLADRRGGELHG
jgi:GDP-L-fucose synthase